MEEIINGAAEEISSDCLDNEKENIEIKTEVKKEKKKLPKQKMSKLEKAVNRKSWLFILPSLIGVTVFFIAPFVVVIYYASINNNIVKRFVGLENILKVLANPSFKQAAANTLKFSFTAVPLAVVLALLLAVVLEKEIPFRSQFRTSFLTPMMVPVASVVLIFQVVFHYNGMANAMLQYFGGSKIDWLKSNYALIVVAILFLWKTLGYNMIIFMAALGAVPREQIEVARLESATNMQIFFQIKLRYLSPTIVFVTLLSLINSFKIFREVYLLTGDYPYESLYMLQHYMNNMFNNLDYQKLSAAAIIMSLFMIVIIGALFAFENHFGKDVEE